MLEIAKMIVKQFDWDWAFPEVHAKSVELARIVVAELSLTERSYLAHWMLSR